jgi:hypothetical protein
MSAFGIIASEFASSDEYYVSEDATLLEWLHANNYGPTDEDSLHSVPAPDGYIFKCGSLYPKDAVELKGLDESELKETEYVSSGSAENDKAMMLMEGAMKSVSRKEFTALNIPEDLTLEYQIY